MASASDCSRGKKARRTQPVGEPPLNMSLLGMRLHFHDAFFRSGMLQAVGQKENLPLLSPPAPPIQPRRAA